MHLKIFIAIHRWFLRCFITAIYSVGSLLQGHCQVRKSSLDNPPINFHVEKAPEWTTLFASDSVWLGGDGLFAISVNGVDTNEPTKNKKTLLVFSDSFWGRRLSGKIVPGGKMINNSVAFIDQKAGKPTNLHFFHGGTKEPKSVFIPSIIPTADASYYWLGDGFVNKENNDSLYIFAYQMKNTKAKVFGFKEIGNSLLIIGKHEEAPFKHYRQLKTPLFIDSTKSKETYSFGAGVLTNTTWAGAPNPDGFIYIYGVRGHKKELLIARVKPKNIEHFDSWKYWDGKTWNSDILKAAGVTSGVSNELSVSPLPKGRYALVFQRNGIDPLIGMRIGETPYGPFGPIIPVYECPEPLQKKTLFAYNAKAHPNLSKKGELLISYHVNSFDFLNDFKSSPEIFSPKFIRIVFD